MFFIDEFGVVWQSCAKWARGAEMHPIFGTYARKVDRRGDFGDEHPSPAGEVRLVSAPDAAAPGCYY